MGARGAGGAAGGGRPAGDTTLDRLIRILDAFDAGRTTLTVAALARRAAIPLPTAYRWVERLTAAGLLERGTGGAVGPGMKLWELASRSAPSTSLRNAAMPFMDDVQAVLRQHTQIAVLDEAGVLVLERLSARGAVPNQATVAGRLPTSTTSLGLVLLAYSPSGVTEDFLARHAEELGAPQVPADLAAGRTPVRGTARGVVNPTEIELRRQLAAVRSQGWAAVDGQVDSEATGVAVPVLTARGRVLAALGVVVPRSSELRPGLAPMLMAAARGISRAVGERQVASQGASPPHVPAP
ncbi:IclR family transcriptional regulator [Georgenia sp. Z1491]|uniref:IclR family transcriptional regulator n=1 Tax=Georgenia sp. Z1491 TaxID=3416707 RepID=UPI003CE81313